jgi:calcineurin-like phosphoesterase family protein
MANLWFISDTHFSHGNILKFVKKDGSPVRPFASVEEMDEHMIEKWNSVVRPQDKVYHLGDVAMHRQAVQVIGRCNGHKRLVRGNHDEYSTKLYMQYFEEVYASRVLDKMIFTHIPIHAECLGRFNVNVHGHVHNNVPALHFGPNYFNVSVEVIDYTPISLEDLKLRVKKQQESFSEIPLGGLCLK